MNSPRAGSSRDAADASPRTPPSGFSQASPAKGQHLGSDTALHHETQLMHRSAMNARMIRWWFALLVAAGAGCRDDDPAEIQAAYRRGDYETVLRISRPLAEEGKPDAQFMLGFLYAEGRGVPKDAAEAVKWYRRSAETGAAYAQHNLALMYAKGEGVPRDLVEAYMWCELASAQGGPDVIKSRDLLATILTPEQVAEAQRRAREWKPKDPAGNG